MKNKQQIQIDKTAYEKLLKRVKKSKLKPRILLRGMSCHGADIGILFDYKKENDIILQSKDLDFIVEPQILTLFKGFKISYETFFLLGRYIVEPMKDIKKCTCDGKHHS